MALLRFSLSFVVCLYASVWAADSGKGRDGLSEETVAALVGAAGRWDLPQPHEDAELVGIWAFSRGEVDHYLLGFQMAGSKLALVGFAEKDTESDEVVLYEDPLKIEFSTIAVTSPFDGVSGTNSGLATGIQLWRRGQKELGQKLIALALQTTSGHGRSHLLSPAGEDPVLMLARSVLASTTNEMTSADPDYVAMDDLVRRLIEEHPELTSPATEHLLAILAATIAYEAEPPPPPGSVEAVIDTYLESAGEEGENDVHDFSASGKALIRLGFDAVPALLELRSSQRATSHVRQGFNNFVSFNLTAGQAVDDYLMKLANSKFDSDWLKQQKGYKAGDDAVALWWKKASAMGERAYVKANTHSRDSKGRPVLSKELLLLACSRHPDLLPGLYAEALTLELQSWGVAEALAEADTIDHDTKVEGLLAGMKAGKKHHRNGALRELLKLDRARGEELLVEFLEGASETTDDVYWTDQDAGLGRYVSTSDNPEVWAALHSYLDRADLGMRMELIAMLRPRRDAAPEIVGSFRAIFRRFEGDVTVRDESTSEKYSGPGAGFPHDVITMQDFVHLHWARWMKLDVEQPPRGASSESWEELRAVVGEAMVEIPDVN